MYYSMVAIEKMNSHEMQRQKDALSPKKYRSGFGFSQDLSYYCCEERIITRNNRKNYCTMSKKQNTPSMQESWMEETPTPKYVKSHEPKPLTVLKAMDWLAETSEDTKLSDDYLTKSTRVNGFLAKKMSITPRQAVLLSIISAESATGETCSQREICNHLGCGNFEMVAMRDDFHELERRHLIRRCRGFVLVYKVTDEVIEAMANNTDIVPANRTGLDFKGFFEQVLQMMRVAIENSENADPDIIVEELLNLQDNNEHLPFVQAMRNAQFINNDDFLCFYYFAHQLVNWDREEVDLRQSNLDDVIGDEFKFARLCRTLTRGDNMLVRNGLLEAVCENGMMGGSFRLTPKAVKEFLTEYKPIRRKSNTNGMLMPDKIAAKALFYNPEEQREVDRLASILDPKNYQGVCDRLEKAGMRRGICVMLSGGPGTGKTETVLQLARQSGRPIMQVNVNDIMDKFVGESEKRAVSIFDNYREAVKNNDVTPILLLNECDQLLGKRLQNLERSVDQMSNALQNIFLQQMETLEGIMLCTTNLVKNLDSAFERRFLFKIELRKPCREARIGIWKNMLPTLSDNEAEQLSDAYDFSGGQIENISRKALIDMAITGVEKPNFEQYIDYCNHEHFEAKKPEYKRVGF